MIRVGIGVPDGLGGTPSGSKDPVMIRVGIGVPDGLGGTPSVSRVT